MTSKSLKGHNLEFFKATIHKLKDQPTVLLTKYISRIYFVKHCYE
jgi:hypothetical protein